MPDTVSGNEEDDLSRAGWQNAPAMWTLSYRAFALFSTWVFRPLLALLAARFLYLFVQLVFKFDPGPQIATALLGDTTRAWIEIGRWSVLGLPALLLFAMREEVRLREELRNARTMTFAALPASSLPATLAPRRILAKPKPRPVVPDRPIGFAFQHLHPAPFRLFQEKEHVGKQVLDRLASGALRGWGREIVETRRTALTEIPKDAWRSARFTYWFLDEDAASRDICHVECDGIERGRTPRLFCDLQINRGQVEAIWPRSA